MRRVTTTAIGKRFTAVAVFFVGLMAASIAHATPIWTLVNPDFETGDLTGWTVTPTTGGGTDVQDVVLFDVDQIGGVTNAARFNVGRTVVTSPSPTGIILSQMFEVATAGLYGFSVDVAGHGALGANMDGGQFQLLIDGISLDSFAAGFVDSGQVKSATLAGGINLGLGMHTFAISILRDFNFSGAMSRQYVDDAVVLAPAYVPEPTTLLLLATGLAALAVNRRRRT